MTGSGGGSRHPDAPVEERRHTELVEGARHRPAIGLVVTAAVVGLLGWAYWALPRGDQPLPALARYAVNTALPKWHTFEPVNEIVYGTRGFDTFGETFLLLAAIMGISMLTRVREVRRGFVGEQEAGAREQRTIDPHAAEVAPSERQAAAAERGEEGGGGGPLTPDEQPLGTPGPERAAAMTVPVRAAVRFLAPVLMISGIYLAAWGYSPGGGFPAGAIMLGVALLAYASLGYRRVERLLRPEVMEPIELAGALLIVAVAVGGLILDGSLTANFLPLGPPQTIRSGGILQVFSGGELIEVGTGLIIAVLGLLAMRDDWVAANGDGDGGGG